MQFGVIEDSVLNEVEQSLSGMGRLEKLVLGVWSFVSWRWHYYASCVCVCTCVCVCVCVCLCNLISHLEITKCRWGILFPRVLDGQSDAITLRPYLSSLISWVLQAHR